MFGYRPDGKKVRDLDPIQRIIPHIMTARHDSQNLTSFDISCAPFDDFIRGQEGEGMRYTYMDILIAIFVRTIAKLPRLNRFVMNGRIYMRNSIQVSFVVKKDLTSEAADSLVKLDFTGLESLPQVREKIDAAIRENSHISANNGTDKLARVLTITPNFLIKWVVGLAKFLDKHGMIPNALLRLSPFHTSIFVTNMKSIGGPSIFHHLYDFGTTGMFFSIGKESVTTVVRKGEVRQAKLLPLWFVCDERFCDGFYFVKALKTMYPFFLNPALLLDPLESLGTDTVVVHGRKARILEEAKK